MMEEDGWMQIKDLDADGCRWMDGGWMQIKVRFFNFDFLTLVGSSFLPAQGLPAQRLSFSLLHGVLNVKLIVLML